LQDTGFSLVFAAIREQPIAGERQRWGAPMAGKIHAIHHVNFPTSDPEKTKEWYSKVFGLKHVDVGAWSDTKVLLMTGGDFDIHFTPVKDKRKMDPFHFAVEIENWDEMISHLRSLNVRFTKPFYCPQNNSTLCYIRDPDNNLVELTFHGNRTK
jgi:catechol 2,3-dioxygenase-like lactoylglutathione lyase family enzyme